MTPTVGQDPAGVRAPRAEAGMTLTELMVSMTITSIVALAILGVQTQLTRAFSAQNRVAEAQQNGRAVADALGRDLRMAGFMISNELWIALTTEGGVPRQLPRVSVRNGDGSTEQADTITVAYADASALATIAVGAGNGVANATTLVSSEQGFAVGDLVVAFNGGVGCVMRLTAVGAGQLSHATGGAGGPWNTASNNACTPLAGVWSDGTTQIAKLTLRSYRVRGGDPRGVIEFSPSGQVVANDWVELGQGVLDIQVAMQVREPADGTDSDGDGDATLDWYSGDAMLTALDSPPLPAPQNAPMTTRLTVVTRGGLDTPTVDTLTPNLCDPAFPANNALGDHCEVAISTVTDPTSRYYQAALIRRTSLVFDLRNVGTGVGTP